MAKTSTDSGKPDNTTLTRDHGRHPRILQAIRIEIFYSVINFDRQLGDMPASTTIKPDMLRGELQ